jgi:hypothetical protein
VDQMALARMLMDGDPLPPPPGRFQPGLRESANVEDVRGDWMGTFRGLLDERSPRAAPLPQRWERTPEQIMGTIPRHWSPSETMMERLSRVLLGNGGR